MILTFLGTMEDLEEMTENELLELYINTNLNSVSKTQINLELAKRVSKLAII